MKRVLSGLMRLRRAESGATALEFAIVASAFVVVAMGIIEFGRSLQVRNEMAYAMDWGARTVLMNASASEADIADAIKARFNSYDTDKLTITILDESAACSGGGTMEARALTLAYPLQIFIPGFTGTLEMSLQRIVPRGECA
jgi:Flp pilus assembly protein TadG